MARSDVTLNDLVIFEAGVEHGVADGVDWAIHEISKGVHWDNPGEMYNFRRYWRKMLKPRLSEVGTGQDRLDRGTDGS